MFPSTDRPEPVRVVIVDDTRSIRLLIRAMLETTPRIRVVGEAGDPYEARDLIRRLNPDVITLDVVMPRMDGLSFLDRLMSLRPMPVVMVSTRTNDKSRAAIRALALGAVDCVDLGQLRRVEDRDRLAQTVLMAAESNLSGFAAPNRRQETLSPKAHRYHWNGKVVLVGSSTGGVDALQRILSRMPHDCPPILVAQHMPPSFLESFAKRLERNCPPEIAISKAGARLCQGQVRLASGGDVHAVLSERDVRVVHHMDHEGTVSHVPSVDLLFSSAVYHARQVIGVMLTGMGRDGADALLRLRNAGAHTIVQDAASAVIDGMPRAARELGAAIEVASLAKIGERILAAAKSQDRGQRL